MDFVGHFVESVIMASGRATIFRLEKKAVRMARGMEGFAGQPELM